MSGQPDLRKMSEAELEEWRLEQVRRSRELYPDQGGGSSRGTRERRAGNAAWPTEYWDFPFTPDTYAEVGSPTPRARLMQVRGLRRVADDGPLAVLLGDEHGMLAVRNLNPAITFGDDLDAESVTIPSVNIMLHVVTWPVDTDTPVLPSPPTEQRSTVLKIRRRRP